MRATFVLHYSGARGLLDGFTDGNLPHFVLCSPTTFQRPLQCKEVLRPGDVRMFKIIRGTQYEQRDIKLSLKTQESDIAWARVKQLQQAGVSAAWWSYLSSCSASGRLHWRT